MSSVRRTKSTLRYAKNNASDTYAKWTHNLKSQQVGRYYQPLIDAAVEKMGRILYSINAIQPDVQTEYFRNKILAAFPTTAAALVIPQPKAGKGYFADPENLEAFCKWVEMPVPEFFENTALHNRTIEGGKELSGVLSQLTSWAEAPIFFYNYDFLLPLFTAYAVEVRSSLKSYRRAPRTKLDQKPTTNLQLVLMECKIAGVTE